eukprot:TRINITY_DN2095_c0_g1_i1.p1 TRINITY_DN2095_c0_g1~~TRINITY_DN2095_c0_g1_i1.p1  ORF type:complete len:431 (-),score=112.20 TRINITY_DN2095_c0_g1_i1:45-1337(-)
MEMVPAVCLSILALSAVGSAFPKIEKNNEDIDADLETHYQRALESAIGDFSQSMYVHLAQTSGEENFVFSPLSLHSALTLLYLGTKDNSVTQQQLGAAMGIVNNPQLLKISYQKVIETYKDQDSFLYGNHIWVGNDIEIKSDYKDLIQRQFGSGVSNLNFHKPDAVEKVNGWISNMTRGKIENLVDSFSSETQMFLANALYFNEKWLEPFEETDYAGNIIEEYFNTNAGKVKVPMIQQTSSKMIYGEIQTENGILEVVTIPYKNNNFEMQIIIPKDKKGLNILEDQMKLKEAQDDKSSFNLFKVLKNESFDYIKDVNLRMPKFKLKSKFDAAEALQRLGAKDIFTSGAELDKIIGGGPVGVGKVIHEAVVEVTKEGTEGAAATGVEIVLFSASFGEEKNIVLDRPFIFIVQDRLNNIPVLVGRVKNPSYP